MSYRITDHPILNFNFDRKWVTFTFNGKTHKGLEGEPVLVALRASGTLKLKEGAKHHTPFGPFCMQGRCCSCNMTVDGKPNTMTCITPLQEGMTVNYQGTENDSEAYTKVPEKTFGAEATISEQEHPEYDVAIIGAGPAGMEAALALSNAGCRRIALLDDKSYLGGQLVLQTHAFFGNEELGAGVRGFDIAHKIASEINERSENIKSFLNATVIGFYPHNVLAFRDQGNLNFIRAKKIIVATGASEKFLPFEGNCLPGVMGAGGAQTLMNIYGVRPGKKVLIVGGGNIGVILAYQLLQAKVEVVAIIEGSTKMGAYAVHVNKVKALGVPILTGHTILRAHGENEVTGATIAKVDANSFSPIAGTEKHLDVDTICLAVGLSPLNELLWQAGIDFYFVPELGEVPRFDKFRQTSQPDIFVAGDCAVIGEASIARLEGRIAGLKAGYDLGYIDPNFNEKCDHALSLLRNIQSGTYGRRLEIGKNKVTGSSASEEISLSKEFKQTFPTDALKSSKDKKIIIRCDQDIPCNPCEASCHLKAIKVGAALTQQPDVDYDLCKGCGLCIPKCPGRAIQVLQYNYSDANSAITIAYEFDPLPEVGQIVEVLNKEGKHLTLGEVVNVKATKDSTKDSGTITFTVPKDYAFDAIAIHVSHSHEHQHEAKHEQEEKAKEIRECAFKAGAVSDPSHASYVCRCEEVSLQEVEELIKEGYHSLHEIKRLKRVGMGACQGLSCSSITQRLLQKQQLSPSDMLHQKQTRKSLFRPPSKKITLGEAARLSMTEAELSQWHTWEQERTLPMELVSEWKQRHFDEGIINGNTTKRKIVIIGGGISGVFTAWWLSRLGECDITVVESDFLAAGKTGACLGGIRTGFNTTNKILRAKKGLEVFRDSLNLIGEEVGWHQGGYVYLAFDDKQDQLFQMSFKEWEGAGVAFTYTQNKSEFLRYVPGLDVSGVKSAVYFPEAGGANPFKATFGFAEDARKKGVQFLTDHELVAIDKNQTGDAVGSVTIFNKVTQKYEKIECEHIVNCGGTGANKISKMVGIDISDQVWIEAHGAMITEKMPMWLDALIVSYHPELSGYWQQKHMEAGVGEGELVACYSPNPVIKGFNKAASLPFLSRMARSILHCCPNLEEVGILRSFAEHYVGRASGIPIIGPTKVKGFWMNVAKKGHGFMCAPGDAFALAQSILGGYGTRHEWISECTVEDQGNLKETMK